MFQLVHLRMTAPRKDDAGVRRCGSTNFAEQLANQLRVPEVQYSQRVAGGAVQGQPAPQAPKPADVAKIDLDKAIAFYKDRFGDASDFTFVIVGAVDLAKLQPLVETYLASLPAKGRKEKEKDLGVAQASAAWSRRRWTLGQRAEGAGPDRRSTATRSGRATRTATCSSSARCCRSGCARCCARTWAASTASARAARSRASPHQERTFTIQFGCDPTRVDELVKAAVRRDRGGREGGHRRRLPREGQADVPARARDRSCASNGFWVGWLERAAPLRRRSDDRPRSEQDDRRG